MSAPVHAAAQVRSAQFRSTVAAPPIGLQPPGKVMGESSVENAVYNERTGAYEEIDHPIRFHPGEDSVPPCYPQWFYQMLVGHHMAMLNSRYLDDRRVAAIALGALARRCPELNIVGMLGLASETMAQRNWRVKSSADDVLNVALGGWYDCRHAGEALLQELVRTDPDVERVTSAWNYLFDTDNAACRSLIEDWKKATGWEGEFRVTNPDADLDILRLGFGIPRGGEPPH